MLQRMGVSMDEIPGVEEVIIRTETKDIVLKGANVSELKAKGMRIFQVVGSDVLEQPRERPKFTEEDVLLVSQQAGVSKDRAQAALSEVDGDLAQSILKLTS
jgi:nascent polypeptide-associated complex subunit alpha